MLKGSTRAEKMVFKSEYVTSRKAFDREVQKCKRRYWFSLQNDLLNECDVTQMSFGSLLVKFVSVTVERSIYQKKWF